MNNTECYEGVINFINSWKYKCQYVSMMVEYNKFK